MKFLNLYTTDIYLQYSLNLEMKQEINEEFWNLCEHLVKESRFILEHKAGTSHPQYSSFIYPVDYGYLKNTKSTDNDEIDVWKGSSSLYEINGCILTVDILKRDMEIKLLLGCSQEEIESIYMIHNYTSQQKGFIILRNQFEDL